MDEDEHVTTPADDPSADTNPAVDAPAVDPAREALVKVWLDRVQRDKRHWGSQFKRMRRDMRFARGYQWANQAPDDERYVANLVLRHVSQKTAALYAKDPTPVVRRRKTLDFQVWDGDPQTLLIARQITQTAQAAGGLLTPMDMVTVMEAQRIVADAEQGMRRRRTLDRIGETLETVYQHQIGEQLPPFKTRMKQLVRRVNTTGVGYVELGYHRLYEPRPEDVDRVTDVTEQIAALEALTAKAEAGDLDVYQAELEELRQLSNALRSQQTMLVREGLDFDFPSSTAIIPDRSCRHLQGFIGARWVTREFLLSPDKIKSIYGVDIGKRFTRYEVRSEDVGPQEVGYNAEKEVGEADLACVYRIYDKSTALTYTVAEGYPDFLEEPRPPRVKLERFWPIFVLSFNETEDENDIFPPSDVSLLRDMQVEHNVSRQRLREHRDANRPKYVTAKGKLDEADKGNLTGAAAHVVVELNGLLPGERIENLLQAVPHAPIDPNLYEVSSYFEDVLRVGGTQEANLGGTSGATATESSIAEASRMTSIGSNIDDLDDFLTELTRSASHVLLTELSADTVREIAGPGAVWPEWAADDIARDLWLEIRAGSSGKPNKAQEIQNMERMLPYLLQIPGVRGKWVFDQVVERLDDHIDITDAFQDDLPSITALNSAAGRPAGPPQATGDPATDPASQGAQGADNGPRPRTDSNMGPNNAAGGPPAMVPGQAPNTAY